MSKGTSWISLCNCSTDLARQLTAEDQLAVITNDDQLTPSYALWPIDAGASDLV
jgi:hypothetical protein